MAKHLEPVPLEDRFDFHIWELRRPPTPSWHGRHTPYYLDTLTPWQKVWLHSFFSFPQRVVLGMSA